VVLAVAPTHPGKPFAPGSVGLSIEAEELATPDLSASHKSLVALMRRLGPSVLRIGGNSVDYSWWSSDNEAPPSWATSVLRPPALVSLHGLLVATGWRAILGVDLGHFDPTRAAAEARSAYRILGSRLLGFEIGNEPDDYGDPTVKLRPSSYNAGDYLDELAAYIAAIRAAVPTFHLYGPDIGTTPPQGWLTTVASAKDTPFSAITHHYYPTTYSVARGVCKGTPLPTALELLSPLVRERENEMLSNLVAAGEIAHRPTLITETNTTSSCDLGGGPDTSPVFASALWSLDWVLRAASAGISGVDFHGYFGRCGPSVFSPVCAPGYTAEAHGQVTAQPEYYGLLAARQLEGGRFVPVEIRGQMGPEQVTAYATIHPHAVITLAIDNLTAVGHTSFLLRVPGYGTARSESLTAPSINATSDIAFGQASITLAGAIRPVAATIRGGHGTFRVAIPPESAIVITLRK
jgi:hypothetical protein